MSVSTLAALGMAIGAPLVYADQAYSIYRKQDARGFSHDVCGVLLLANITRCVFWLGERFEAALLLQSLLMIAAQLGLLHLCIRFKPVTRFSKSLSSDGARVVFDAPHEHEAAATSASVPTTERDLMDLQTAQDEEEGMYADKQPLLVTLGALFRGQGYARVSPSDPTASTSSASSTPMPAPVTAPPSRLRAWWAVLKPERARPLNFWQWSDYNSYLVFLALFTLLLLLLYLGLGGSATFVAMLGYAALGLESTLPIPQLIANYRRKSLAGFRPSVLVGWLGGDSFKLLYFWLRASPVQFTSCAAFQLSIDLAILAQARLYRENTQRDQDNITNTPQRPPAQADGEEVEQDEDLPPARTPMRKPKSMPPQKAAVADEQDLLHDPHHVIAIEADDDDDQGDIANSRRT